MKASMFEMFVSFHWIVDNLCISFLIHRLNDTLYFNFCRFNNDSNSDTKPPFVKSHSFTGKYLCYKFICPKSIILMNDMRLNFIFCLSMRVNALLCIVCVREKESTFMHGMEQMFY